MREAFQSKEDKHQERSIKICDNVECSAMANVHSQPEQTNARASARKD